MRSKTLLFILGTGLLAIFMTACSGITGQIGDSEIVSGSGTVVTENREVSGFTAVTLQGFGEVIVDLTGSETLSITADDNFLPYLETEVRGDTLYIRGADNVVFTDVTKLTFHVTAAALDTIKLEGAGSMTIHDLDTDNWQVFLPGAGSITVSGQAAKQTVEMEGAGSYQAEDLVSEQATIKSSGAGSAVVQVSDTLDVTIDGLGSVQYIGNPTVTKEINGVGTVSQRP